MELRGGSDTKSGIASLRECTLNRMSQDWDNSTVSHSVLRCNVWSIPSMADGQGRSLGSGPIPDVPLRRKAILPQYIF